MLLSVTLFLLVPVVWSYCAGAGQNPGFTAGPVVEQVSLTRVRVSWYGIVTKIGCADQFIVKWWIKNDPNDYGLSSLLTTDKFFYVLSGVGGESVIPNREYAFQAVAREDKGWLGKDWNKSPITYFKTSRSNPTVDVETDPLPPPNSQIPTERPTPDRSGGGGQPSPSKNKSTKRPKKRVNESETNEGLNGVLEMGGMALGALLALLLVVGVAYNFIYRRIFRSTGREKDEDDLSDSESLHLENTPRR